MKIERTSALTGVIRTMELDVTKDQIIAWKNGELAQLAFPDLSPNEREFIISGIVAEEWDQMFGGEE